ncbi:hypothetical protein KIN20_008028 [Parelaphostrongylus tenuis]|uniref:Uncharacterized protein n=1 Tax=Parelaphostrongylus tenuis TaxID=148309 RepID=A0AAD5QME9_PARTN|nr:hypothetical protein KIN20_008028 [Parelaphostrongylus tenuis]
MFRAFSRSNGCDACRGVRAEPCSISQLSLAVNNSALWNATARPYLRLQGDSLNSILRRSRRRRITN